MNYGTEQAMHATAIVAHTIRIVTIPMRSWLAVTREHLVAMPMGRATMFRPIGPVRKHIITPEMAVIVIAACMTRIVTTQPKPSTDAPAVPPAAI